MIVVMSSFSKSSVFSARTKTQNRRFQIPPVWRAHNNEERFRKAPFSWLISVDGRLNRRNKAAFSNFSGVVWSGSKMTNFSRCDSEFQCLVDRGMLSYFGWARQSKWNYTYCASKRNVSSSTSRSRNKLIQQSGTKPLSFLKKRTEVITNQRFYNFQKKVKKTFISGSRDGAVVRALASHQCDLVSILAWRHMWVELVVGSRFTPTAFLRILRFSPSTKTIISKCQKNLLWLM